jgi:hypothetical protein
MYPLWVDCRDIWVDSVYFLYMMLGAICRTLASFQLIQNSLCHIMTSAGQPRNNIQKWYKCNISLQSYCCNSVMKGAVARHRHMMMTMIFWDYDHYHRVNGVRLSLNCGRQHAYSSSATWYMSIENHVELNRQTKIPDLSSRVIW